MITYLWHHTISRYALGQGCQKCVYIVDGKSVDRVIESCEVGHLRRSLALSLGGRKRGSRRHSDLARHLHDKVGEPFHVLKRNEVAYRRADGGQNLHIPHVLRHTSDRARGLSIHRVNRPCGIGSIPSVTSISSTTHTIIILGVREWYANATTAACRHGNNRKSVEISYKNASLEPK